MTPHAVHLSENEVTFTITIHASKIKVKATEFTHLLQVWENENAI